MGAQTAADRRQARNERIREMRARGVSFATAGRLCGVTDQTARKVARDVEPPHSVKEIQLRARGAIMVRAAHYQRFVARVARVMPEAVR